MTTTNKAALSAGIEQSKVTASQQSSEIEAANASIAELKLAPA